jgi:ribosome biogenesis protein MAK21
MRKKFLSLIVKRINIIFKYVKNNENQMQKINQIINEKIKVLFKLSHNKSLKLSIEILKLLYGIISFQDQNFKDRYYKSLYDLISNNSLSLSKHVKEALKLIMISLMYDNNINRISSFLKRLLEMSLVSEPSYIICILIIVSQIIRNKKKLWKLIEKNQTNIKNFYDSSKRDPRFANGENSFLNELYLLSAHYHPSVQRMSKFIIENYNKEEITYNGDPLIDFSLVNFLEKFILKNPKIKKEKKKLKINKEENNEEEELKKFIENAEKEDNKKDNKNNIKEDEIIGEDDFEFISKFNKVYPKITNSKNYLKKLKKQEKKKKENDEDDIINEKEKDDELDDYADKIIEEEYKKYDKDIDDDDIEDLGEIEEEENENNDNEENENDEDNDINNEENENDDLFADASEYEDNENEDEDEIIDVKPKKKQRRK